MVKKSTRNKTIDLTIEEGEHHLNKIRKETDDNTKLSNIINQVINGDTFNILKDIPKNSIDLIIVDPPYNLTKDYHGHKYNKKRDNEYEEYTRGWVDLVEPLLKDTGSMYVCCDWKSSLIIGRILGEKFTIKNRITWQREKGRGAKSNWKNGMEDIWFVTKTEDYTFNVDDVKQRRLVRAPYKENGQPKDWEEVDGGKFRDTYPSNFWDDISIPYWSMSENTAHPTQKPEKLIAKLILASSKEGDIILDPFNGSGTTSVVASKLGRKYIGIEQNLQYCVWTMERLDMIRDDDTIQGLVDGVFWERNTTQYQKQYK